MLSQLNLFNNNSNEYQPLVEKSQKKNNFKTIFVVALILIVCIYFLLPSTVPKNGKESVFEQRITEDATTDTLRVAYIEHVALWQYNVTSQTVARTIMNNNLNILEAKVSNASANNVTLILFPEFALTGLVNFLAASMLPRVAMAYYLEQIPSPGQGTISLPCNNSLYSGRPILQRLSCMAKTYGVYLNVNWGDYITCNSSDSKCPSNKQYQYNTQIVFNKYGEIVAKYWKIHLFNEDEFDSPAINYTGGTYFTMYYGTNNSKSTKIGLATCFDSMYAVPIWYLIKSQNISFFMISHWWVNGDITSTAPQWFQSLSRQYNINLVVAASTWFSGTVYPYASSGSGVYTQGKVLSEFYNWNSTRNDTLGWGDIPLSLSSSTSSPAFSVTTIPTYINSTTHPTTFQYCYTYLGYAVAGQTLTGTLTCPGFNCTARLKVSSLASPYYNYWTMRGIQNWYNTSDGNNVYYYEQICSIYCSTCTTYVGSTQFDTINITGQFNSNAVPFVLMMQNYGKSYVNATTKTYYSMSNGKFSLNGSGIYPDYINDITVQSRVFSLDTIYAS